MPVRFRSLRSGSSANAAMIWDEQTRLLIDCGVRAQRRNPGDKHDCGKVDLPCASELEEGD